jgi:signal transduction histidine kinase
VNWLAEHAPIISGFDGVVELSVAVLIILGVRSRQGRIPLLGWLVISYFLIESLVSFNRVFARVDAEGTLSRVVILEVIGTVVIVLMLANASRIANAIAFLIDEAKYRAFEYERARDDYTQVVRHRIANPLMIIKGAALTLEGDSLDDATRHELRRAIIEAAERLEAISLEPTRQGTEERDLDAVPNVGSTRP